MGQQLGLGRDIWFKDDFGVVLEEQSIGTNV